MDMTIEEMEKLEAMLEVVGCELKKFKHYVEEGDFVDHEYMVRMSRIFGLTYVDLHVNDTADTVELDLDTVTITPSEIRELLDKMSEEE